MPHAHSSFLPAWTRGALALVGTSFILVSAALGCSAIQVTTDNGPTPISSFDGVDDAASGDAGAQAAFAVDGGSTIDSPYTGSPLCHASPSTCFPDTTISTAASADAGAADGSTNPGLACADPTSGAATDSAPTDACRVRTQTPNDPMPTCVAGGQGEDSAKCSTGSDCAPGYDCTSDGVCRKYCCSGTCDVVSNGSPTFCDIVSLKDEQTLVPACVPVVGCDLLGDSCPAKETCSIVKDDGTTSCVAVGAAGAGDSCDEVHCAENLVCLGQPGARQCFELCKIANATCPSGTTCKSNALVATDTSVGICETPQM